MFIMGRMSVGMVLLCFFECFWWVCDAILWCDLAIWRCMRFCVHVVLRWFKLVGTAALVCAPIQSETNQKSALNYLVFLIATTDDMWVFGFAFGVFASPICFCTVLVMCGVLIWFGVTRIPLYWQASSQIKVKESGVDVRIRIERIYWNREIRNGKN